MTREKLMKGLESIISIFQKQNIHQEIWIDGSFVTEKINPNDVDIVAPVDFESFSRLTKPQQDILRWYANEDLKQSYGCDNYTFFEYLPAHPDFSTGQAARNYWLDLFGTDRDGYKKGIAVLKSW